MIDVRYYLDGFVDCLGGLCFFFGDGLVARLLFEFELFFAGVRIVYPF